ncbi:MAG: hypothetical protein VX815_17590 [Gemmatimonadota bacterium]|nr:hypothetical protein [Gemmatimonadota bacterium]
MSGSRLLGTSLLLLTATWSSPAIAAAQDTEMAEVNQSENPLLRPFVWRSIGPIGQGGRVDDIAVDPTNPFRYFVGFATGGLWRTTNNGTTFEPVFDEYETHSVGAIGIAPSDPDVIYVGTGESNNRQSSSFGAGVYKSTDGGDSFTYMGLRETQSIARVIVHPTDANTAWIAANGHLFGSNPERGVFKTTNGGRTWEQVLRIDDNTGATDLIIDPSNPDKLLAATYQRRRTGCCFVGGGPGSGIWMSTDGGENWDRLEGNGLPNGTMGRIALATTPADPDVIYAQIEVAADKERPLTADDRAAWQALAQDGDLQPDHQWNGIWRSSDGGMNWQFRSNENGRPMYFSQIRVSPEDPDLVYTVDQQVAKSRDGGQTWETLSGYGHVDQHAVWINPNNHDHLIIGNDGSIDVSYDQGETWESPRTWAVGQPYHVSVNMERPYRVCTGLQDNGTWCGPSSVRSGPILPQDWFRAGGGDGFYTQQDPTDPNIIYTESQGGNMNRYDLSTGDQQTIRPRGPGGRGGRGGGGRGGRVNIVPEPPTGTQIRLNWNTPFVLSPHNSSTIYAASNRFFISRDRGDTWTMSPDLSKNVDTNEVEVMGIGIDVPRCRQLDRGIDCNLSRNDGVNQWSTGVSVAESPVLPGVLWMGTDDGNINVSRDGGATWTEVSGNLPGGTTEYYVSRVEASYFDAGTAYVSLDGHRSDDLRPYVYKTADYGETWQSISSDLPDFGNVNTVRQDPRNADILYVGTEFGFFISGDEGQEWHRFMNGLPVVRIDDVLVHPRDNDLVLATHGRSVYIMDDITALQATTGETMAEAVHLYEPREAVQWGNQRTMSRSVTGDKNWTGENAPTGSAIDYWLDEAADDVNITITNTITGEVVRNLEGTGMAGMNRVHWNLRGDAPQGGGGRGGGGRGGGGGGRGGRQGPQAQPGVYNVTLSVDGDEHTTTVRVLQDRWMN